MRPYKQLSERENVIKAIEDNISQLDDNDAAGHIWWNRFLEFFKRTYQFRKVCGINCGCTDNSECKFQPARKVFYLLESKNTRLWLVRPTLEPYVHSYLHGQLSGPMSDQWTNDVQKAWQWADKAEALEYRNNNFGFINYLITEHEFV